MKIFGWLAGKKAPTGGERRRRGPSKSAEEQRQRRIERMMRGLEKTNPQLAQELTLQQAGLSPKKDDKHPLQELVQTVKMLKDVGLFPQKSEDLAEDGLSVKDMIEGVVGGLALLRQQQMIAPAPFQVPTPPPQPAPQLPAATESTGAMPQEEHGMSLMSALIISQLKGKSPEQAARWLMGQAQANQVVAVLRSTPDENLPAVLAQYAEEAPELAGLISWLRNQPAWLLETVRTVRALSGEAPTVSMGL